MVDGATQGRGNQPLRLGRSLDPLGMLGTKRIARHLWRMCFGLFIASGSFFLGPQNRPLRLLSSVGVGQHLPAALFSVGVYVVLTVLPLFLLVFWLLRVRFARRYKRPTPASVQTSAN